MTIKDFITPQEFVDTMTFARQFRIEQGVKSYLFFKKLATIAAVQGGWGGYVNYSSFINTTKDLLKTKNMSPYDIFCFKERLKNNGRFYGMKATDVCLTPYQDLFSKLCEKREIFFNDIWKLS
jgi:hypothetical protein